MKTQLFCACVAATILTITPAVAQHEHHKNHHDHQASIGSTPIGITGDHVHEKNSWMLSYRYMNMHMDGNRNGTNELSPLDISGDFANTTGNGPTTLRIVPIEMEMEMHMVGAMFAPLDNVTLMVMGNYQRKEMDHITFAGGNPDLEIGRFTTKSSGFGDTKLAGLLKAYENGNHQIVAKAGISLPTGAIKERGDILNPLNARQNIRLPYAMQLGSGTYDFEPALTYTSHNGALGWGAAYVGQIRIGNNNENYTLGDKHVVNAWGSYRWNDWLQNSVRVTGEQESKIHGRDSQIAGPVQTADPDNYGGQHLGLNVGLNLTGTQGVLKGHNIGAEITVPLYQNLNGPQMQRDYGFIVGYQVRF